MTTAKRRINSTGRQRIPRDRVDIRLLPIRPGLPLGATASLKLDGLGFPPDAAVVIEAYHRTSGMRFECGTAENIKVPDLLSLDELDRSGSVLFRVKIIDRNGAAGKILGSAERLRPSSNENDEGRRSIFPIRESDIGDEVWRVELDDDTGPVLLLNYDVPGFAHRLLENPFIRGVLLPAAFRIVLEHLAFNPQHDDDDEENWKVLWFRYVREQLEIEDDVSELKSEERRDWIEDVLRKFCHLHNFVEKIRAMNEGPAVS